MSIFGFNTNDLIFRPMISWGIMLPYAIIMLVLIILNRKGIIRRILILALIVIISQRPMLRDQEDIVFNMDLDVLFVIDTTVSMNAVDSRGTMRLESVKADCKSIMEAFHGSSFAVITYGNIAQVKYPFTSDAATIEDVIDRLKIIDPNYATGSTLDMPYEYMKMLLESSNEKEKHKSIVFFMGDGELTKSEQSGTNLDQYKDLQELIDSGAVLGYGTVEGGKVKITESIILDRLVDNEGYLLDASTTPSKVAISKLDENNLKTLATNLDLSYYHMTDYSDLKDKISEIKNQAVEDDEDEEKMDKDIYYYFSGALTILMLFELFRYRRNEQ